MGNHQFAAEDVTSSPRNMSVSEPRQSSPWWEPALPDGFAGAVHNPLVPRVGKDQPHAYLKSRTICH